MTQEEREMIGKSNWLEDKEKAGTPVTVDEVDDLWQEAVQDVMEIERMGELADVPYLMMKKLAILHADLWELRDAAQLAIRDRDMSYMAYKALQEQNK